jgi:hypothetical protein
MTIADFFYNAGFWQWFGIIWFAVAISPKMLVVKKLFNEENQFSNKEK